MMTGTILALSRAIGEAAPLLALGAISFYAYDPTPLSPFAALPLQIFGWTTKPQAAFHQLAAAASLVLVVLLMTMNGVAIWVRNRYRREW
jgi:phosphate transport system permease protein